VQATNQRLYRAYLLKEQLRQVFKLRGDAGIALLKVWLAWASRSKLEAFVELARSIRNHRAAIEAALVHGLTNARVESVNTKIRLLQRVAFGYRTPKRSSPWPCSTSGAAAPTCRAAPQPEPSDK